MFESLKPAAADAILGLIGEHRADPRAEKIDLGVGVYRNEAGNTPVLDVVKKAEHRLVGTQTSGSIGLWDWGPNISPLGSSKLEIVFSKGAENYAGSSNYMESFRIFQGSCELNQTKHNATKQSYMSCLENKTRKINFT